MKTDLSWEELLERARSSEELSPLARSQAEWAIDHLSRHLPSHVLELSHHFGRFCVNRAPWVLNWLTLFSNSLLRLEASSGFESLLSRLADPTKYDEAMSVLQVASRLAAVDLSVSIDIPVQVDGKIKVPDLRIKNVVCDDKLFVEVSVLGLSDDQRQESEHYRQLSDLLFMNVPQVISSGRLLRTLSESHFEEVKRRITDTIEVVKKHRKLQELHMPDVVTLAIAPADQATALNLWCERHSIDPGSFSGPTGQVDHVKRLKIKTRKEAEQLPDGFPNIIYVWYNDLAGRISNPASILPQLEEMVFALPSVCLVVVAARVAGLGQSTMQMSGMNRFGRTVYGDFIAEDYIVIPNRFCTAKIAPATFTKLISAFSA
ncbi:MAG: hypothetical protein AB7T07_13510 [Steroidobacteraceae bacterium]